ncbi:nucleotidyltransferase domain-containing protein [Paenibacillus sp. NPDC056579]|uniref:nucleotidyltransferase domain-containing protein n=1 Tax=unclassified Paenibacillus TaxID=185978 RepID=UPI001EF7979F|nr:nucleotidyltransferase domain-containing protein [Paenibacillus sp. H1-7]ULL16501.1 nucleotidyltransferase domain-containing protein [Paenibacillus sp. H1-7]
MYPHHQTAIEMVTNKLKVKEEILAVIVGGSVAHGFAKEDSDIDLMLVVSDERYYALLESGDIHYHETESTPYDGGYVDGKYTSISYIKKVAESGSEPARFAFKDAIVSYSEIIGLEELVQAASRYPIERKNETMEKFHAQFEGWRWMFYEGLKKNEPYVIEFSVTNFVLFAGRLILAYNEVVYPYHKWFMKVLEGVNNQPNDLILIMNNVLKNKSKESVEVLYECVAKFYQWPRSEKGWHIRFMLDSELNWMTGHVPVADL